MPMKPEDLIASLREIEYVFDWETVRTAFGFHRSRKIGSGFRFEGVRPEYFWPIGRINERVTEQTGEVHVNVWRSNRNISVFFLADLSGSIGFGSIAPKWQRVARVATAVAYSAYRNRDDFTLVGFADKVLPSVIITPAQRDKDLPYRVAEALLGAKPSRQGVRGIDDALEFLPQREMALVFLASDFLPEETFLGPLAEVAERHDLVPIVLRDIWERTLPVERGFVTLRDAESDEELTLWLGGWEAEKFRAERLAAAKRLGQAFRRLGTEPLWLDDTHDEIEALANYFVRRLS